MGCTYSASRFCPTGLLSHFFGGYLIGRFMSHIVIFPHFMLPKSRKTFEIRPTGLLSNVLAVLFQHLLMVIKMYASIHFMTICPLAHNIHGPGSDIPSFLTVHMKSDNFPYNAYLL